MHNAVQKPKPPYRALIFYMADNKSNKQRLHDFVDKLITIGGKPTGVAVIEGEGPFQFNPDEVIDIWKTGKQELFHLVFKNLLDIGGNSLEIIESTYLVTEHRDAEREPVTILFQEGPFEDIAPMTVTNSIAQVRNPLVEKFIQIAEVAEAAYASITTRHVFLTPMELADYPNSSTFSTFYLGRDTFGHDNVKKIKTAYRGAYIRDTKYGVYISTYPHFNPEDKYLPNPPFEVAGQIVANTLVSK